MSAESRCTPAPAGGGFRRRKAHADPAVSAATPTSGPAVVTGLLEVKSARDGRLDVVVVAAGSGERVPIAYPAGLADLVRDNVLREVVGGGRLFRSGPDRILRLEWLRVRER